MSSAFRVVIADFLDDSSVESPILEGIAEVVLARATSETELAPFLPAADLLILNHEIAMLGETSLAKAPKCRAIVRAGVGYNNVDLPAATARGIVVCNVPDYGTEEVADHAILLLLATARLLVPAHQAILKGQWDYRVVSGAPRLRGKVLGLVGLGRIGTATALRAKAFGLDVVFFDPFVPPGTDKAIGVRRADSLEDLMGQSAFVSLHCFLDARSRHLINAQALAIMPPGGILINTSRGGVVDQEALITALESGHLAGAGLDVVEREPLDDERLRTHPRVVLTPHSAFYSVESFVEQRQKAAEEARRLLLGQPPRCPLNLSQMTKVR